MHDDAYLPDLRSSWFKTATTLVFNKEYLIGKICFVRTGEPMSDAHSWSSGWGIPTMIQEAVRLHPVRFPIFLAKIPFFFST